MRTRDIYRQELRKIRSPSFCSSFSMLLKDRPSQAASVHHVQPCQHGDPGCLELFRNRYHGRLDCIRKSRFLLLDDQQCLWRGHHHLLLARTTVPERSTALKKSVRVSAFVADLATALTVSAHVSFPWKIPAVALYHRCRGSFDRCTDHADHCPCLCALRLHRDLLRSTSRSRQCADPHAPDLRRYLRHQSLWIFFFVPSHRAVETIIFSYPGSWVLTAILFVLYFTWYARKHWNHTASGESL